MPKPRNERKRVDAFEMWCYRTLPSVMERKTNAWVLEKIGSAITLRSSTARRKLRYFGHIIRHTNLERDIIQGQAEGLRGRGRPPASWMGDMRALTGGIVVEATRLACSRVVWRALVSATPARVHNTSPEWHQFQHPFRESRTLQSVQCSLHWHVMCDT